MGNGELDFGVVTTLEVTMGPERAYRLWERLGTLYTATELQRFVAWARRYSMPGGSDYIELPPGIAHG